ncbi:MAG: rhodanese-like domain-containing protein [Proteobacteria bacterium]|nr:rhodanese-like domain-containing protein [Pseudomonadota bacterium]
MDLFLEFVSQQWILVTALSVVVFMLFFHESRKSGPSLSPQQAITMVNAQGGLFLDIRDAGDYKQGHIVDALHLPAAKLASRMAELEKYKNSPIVLVCKMGQQASAAGKTLKANGFEHVYKMTGGMMEWGNLQLPTISKS